MKYKNSKKNIDIKGNFARAKLSGSLMKLSLLYRVKKRWVILLIITLVSMLSGFIGVLCLQNTGLYNVGLEAFAQGIARFVAYFIKGDTKLKANVMNALFWSLIIVLNIPLIFFGWYKIGKKFTFYSTYYIVVSSLFGLSLGYIPGIENVFLFAKVQPHPIFVQSGVQVSLWNYGIDTVSQVSLFIYGFLYGFLQAICYATLFIIGTSSGGLDFIVVWYAEKKYKDLGTVFTYFNILCFVISYFLGTYVTSSLTINENLGILISPTPDFSKISTRPWDLDLFFSPNFMATLLLSIVLGFTLNQYFPKYQMSKVEIVSRNFEEIRNHVISQKKPYSLSIKTLEGGYSRLPQKMLVTICMFMDAKDLLELTRQYDQNALFVVTLVKSVDGYVYMTKEEEEFALWSFFRRMKKGNKNSAKAEEERKIHFEVDKEIVTKQNDKTITKEVVSVIEASEVCDDSVDDNSKPIEKEIVISKKETITTKKESTTSKKDKSISKKDNTTSKNK